MKEINSESFLKSVRFSSIHSHSRNRKKDDESGSAEEHAYVEGLAEEVKEQILHATFIPFGDIKDAKTPLDQAIQKHRSFGFVTFLGREDASAAINNIDEAELFGRVLTVNCALPEKTKGGEQGWAAQPISADADTWFERQQQEEEMQKLQPEQKAAMQAAEELHRKKMAEDQEGERTTRQLMGTTLCEWLR